MERNKTSICSYMSTLMRRSVGVETYSGFIMLTLWDTLIISITIPLLEQMTQPRLVHVYLMWLLCMWLCGHLVLQAVCFRQDGHLRKMPTLSVDSCSLLGLTPCDFMCLNWTSFALHADYYQESTCDINLVAHISSLSSVLRRISQLSVGVFVHLQQGLSLYRSLSE